MRIGQGVRTGLGQKASPVSYRHNFLVFHCFSEKTRFDISCESYARQRIHM